MKTTKKLPLAEKIYRENEGTIIYIFVPVFFFLVAGLMWLIYLYAPLIGTILVWTVKVLITLGIIALIIKMYYSYKEHYPSKTNE